MQRALRGLLLPRISSSRASSAAASARPAERKRALEFVEDLSRGSASAVRALQRRLASACIPLPQQPPKRDRWGQHHQHQLRQHVAPSEALAIVKRVREIFAAETNVVSVGGGGGSEEGVAVHIFGDIHGQFASLEHVLSSVGWSSDDIIITTGVEDHEPPFGGAVLVFAGDYIDRGLYGVECLLLLFALKIAFPRRIVLLRGNHVRCFFQIFLDLSSHQPIWFQESRRTAVQYGFVSEAQQKVGQVEPFLATFAEMPVAALIHGETVVVHGGLWRSPTRFGEPGTLEELQRRPKVGTDARTGSAGAIEDPIIADALWSDPMPRGHSEPNYQRGSGILFGPDFTKAFLTQNRVRLVLRAHEGPDARESRPGMGSMDGGFCVDHVLPGVGMLATLFSAPDFPSQQQQQHRRGTLGAFATIAPPDFAAVRFTQFAI